MTSDQPPTDQPTTALTPQEEEVRNMLRRPTSTSEPSPNEGRTFNFEAPPSFRKKPNRKKKTKVPKDPALQVDVAKVKKSQETSVQFDELPRHLLVPTLEEKAAFVRSLAWGAPRFELRIVPNQIKQAKTAGQALTVTVRDRVGLDNDIINTSCHRLFSEKTGITYLDTMAHEQMMTMACMVTAYDHNTLPVFNSDVDKPAADQVDAMRLAHRKMFGGMNDMQIKYCFLAVRIFAEKTRRLQEGVVNEDFFATPS